MLEHPRASDPNEEGTFAMGYGHHAPRRSAGLDSLTPEEEARLVAAAQAGDAVALARLLDLARRTVAAQVLRLRGVRDAEVDDLVQEGLLAVADVVASFTPVEGARLITAIHLRVRRRVMEAAARMRGVPDRSLRRYYEHLRRSDGDVVAARSSAVASGMTGATFDAIASALDSRPLTPKHDTADDDETAAVVDRRLVAALLDGLPDRERCVLVWAFGLDGPALTDGAIAARLGIDRSRVVRCRQRALARLRSLA